MAEYKIGKVIGVSGDRIDIILLDEDEGGQFGVPEAMTINIDTKDGHQPVLIGQPGSFVKIRIPTGQLLCMVTDIHMKESPILISESRNDEKEGRYPVDSPKRIISVVSIGTIDVAGNFEIGTDILPTVNSDANAVLNETIDNIYENYSAGNFSIGKLSLIPNQDAKINLDSFLSRHAAILGQTGSGKSWTIASFLQNIARFPKSTMLLFDLSGEYKDSFGDYCDYIDVAELEFPYWLMNSEEIIGLMVDRSENAAPNQIAKFKELLQNAKEENDENKSLNLPKITIDTPVYFDFKNILDEFRRLDSEKVPGKNGEKQGPLFGNFTRLLMRIDSKFTDKRYNLIFHPERYTTSASMEDLFRRILGEKNKDPKKLVVVNMSSIPFDVHNSIISLILRCVFDFAYWYKRTNDTIYPIAVFCDEAHIYFNERETQNESARLSAERIAKEGRKYGISITVMSQRPREVSATILSQCNTFMCLRITNPDDQSYVKNLLPDSIRGISNMFSTLRRGECILLGDSVIMPTRIKISSPNPKPTSEDASFFGIWNSKHESVDFESILDGWRRQGYAKPS